jgi:ATP-dependent helicase/nuclease subunit A
MEIKWSTAQKKAIEKRDSNLLISAGAGSGKTAVLTQKVYELVKSGTNIEKVLMFTFTKAAALEMKERLIKKLTNDKNLNIPVETLLGTNITTVHSFCYEVVKSNFHVLGIDPGFSIGDSSRVQAIIDDSLEYVMDEYYSKDSLVFEELLFVTSNFKTDDGFRKMILSLRTFLLSRPNYLKWLENANINYDNSGNWIALGNEHLEFTHQLLLQIYSQILEIIDNNVVPSKYKEFFLNENKYISDSKINSINFQRLVSPKKGEEFDIEAVEEIKYLRDRAKNIVKESIEIFNNGWEDSIGKDLLLQKEHIRIIYEVFKKLDDRIFEIKKKRNIFEFSDLEHLALKALDSINVSNYYKELFDFVFVDEYQDTSDLQEAIIEKIVKPNNLFMVGDIKQSIYRFRGAKPNLFLEKYNTYSKDDSSIDYKIILNENYRSSKKIIDIVNHLFKNLMSLNFGEMDYDEDASLNFANHSIDDKASSVSIHINYLEKGDEKPHIIANSICDRIEELHNKGISYGEIGVLYRNTKRHIPFLKEAMGLRNIPYFSNSGSKFLDNLEVKLILNYLRLIDNIRNDIALLSVLRTPVIGFTDEDLYKIGTSDSKVSFFDRLITYSEIDSTKEKIQSFLSLFLHLREKSKGLFLDDLVLEVLSVTGLFEYLYLLEDGEKRIRNIYGVIQKARAFMNENSMSLLEFIEYIDKTEKMEKDLEGPIEGTESDKSVKIMSIHGSKGLQFKAVIIGGLFDNFNKSELKDIMALDDILGIGMKNFDVKNRILKETIPRFLMNKNNNLKSLSEEMRILYVGMTRAMEHLVLDMVVREEEIDSLKNKNVNLMNLQMAKSMGSWITMILGKEYSSNFYYHNKVNKSFEIKKEIDKLKLMDNPKLYQIEKKKYIKSKYSVSEIINVDSELGYQMPYPRIVRDTFGLTFAQIGTYVHKFMELVDLKRIKEERNLRAQAEYFINNSILPKEFFDFYDFKHIENFFNSDIGVLLIESEEIKRETPFVVKWNYEGDEVLIQGIIDLYFINNSKAYILDFKTDRNLIKDKEKLSKYENQVNIYAYAIENLKNIKVCKKIIYTLSNDDYIEVI